MSYKPLPPEVRLGSSDIHDVGLFAWVGKFGDSLTSIKPKETGV